MTYAQLFKALQSLGPDYLQKQVILLDDNGQLLEVDSFIYGDATDGLTDDPFQALLVL